MGKNKGRAVIREKDLRTFEGPNVIRPNWPKPPTKTKVTAKKIGEIVAWPGRALEAADHPAPESVASTWHPASGTAVPQEFLSRGQEIELRKASLWREAIVLTPSNKEILLAQSLKDSNMSEAWQQEAFRQLEKSENEADHG